MKSVLRYGMIGSPAVVVNVPLPSPVPPKPPLRDRVEALHELERAAVLAERELAGLRAVDRVVVHGCSQIVTRSCDVRDALVDERRAGDEEHEPGARRTAARPVAT